MKNKIKRLLLSGIIIASLLSLTACNTMEGLGKDIQKGGQELENAAD